MSATNMSDSNQPYVVIYTSNRTVSIEEPFHKGTTITRTIGQQTTRAAYFTDLREAADFRAKESGVLLKNLVVEVTEGGDE